MKHTKDVGVALVTGAGSGIGAALAHALAAVGYRVACTDRDGVAATATAASIRQGRGLASAHRLDVTDAAAFAEIVEHVEQTEGPITMLVNNAGVGLAGAVEDLTLADWDRVIDVNLRGVAHGVAAVYPRMVARRAGTVLNIGSGAGLCPRPGMVAYAATKAAVVGLSTSLAAEASAHGVHVAVACPGYVATAIMAGTTYRNLDQDALIAQIPISPITADEAARRILRGVRRRRVVIPVGAEVSLEWWLWRWCPSLVGRVARWRAQRFFSARSTPQG